MSKSTHIVFPPGVDLREGPPQTAVTWREHLAYAVGAVIAIAIVLAVLL